MKISKHFTRGISFLIAVYHSGIAKLADVIVAKTKCTKGHKEVVDSLNVVVSAAVVLLAIFAPALIIEFLYGMLLGSIIGGIATIMLELCYGKDIAA